MLVLIQNFHERLDLTWNQKLDALYLPEWVILGLFLFYFTSIKIFWESVQEKSCIYICYLLKLHAPQLNYRGFDHVQLNLSRKATLPNLKFR